MARGRRSTTPPWWPSGDWTTTPRRCGTHVAHLRDWPWRREESDDGEDAVLLHDVAGRLHVRPGRRHGVAAAAPGAEPGRGGHRRPGRFAARGTAYVRWRRPEP